MRLYGFRNHGCRTDEFLWRGHRLVTIENELLRVSTLLTKGADIIELRYKPRDLDVLWHAPQAILPPGQNIATVARAQGAFLDNFPGGWQEILPNGGPATHYKNAEHGQHGEVAVLPWDVRVIEDSAARVELEFTVETRRTPFRLERTLALETGSPVLYLRETVTNLGEEQMHFAWGHHPALGEPFLEPGCTIELCECEVIEPPYANDLARRFVVGRSGTYPHLEMVNGSMGRVDVVQGKESRTEDVLLFQGFNEGRCAVRNENRGVAFCLRWDSKVFPYLWCWQVYGGSWQSPFFGRIYTVAVEPFNCPVVNLAEASANNLVPVLRPGCDISTSLQVEIQEFGPT